MLFFYKIITRYHAYQPPYTQQTNKKYYGRYNSKPKEKIIVIKALINLGLKEDNVNEIIKKAEEIEKESNQILEFTKEIKNLNKDSKIKIVEELWKIIYSDNNPDIYENNLMRRLTGLLYLDPKIVGDIKEKIKNNLVK